MNPWYPCHGWREDVELSPPWTGAGGPQVRPAWRTGANPGILLPLSPHAGWSLGWTCATPVFVTPHGLVEPAGNESVPPLFCAFCPEYGVLAGESAPTHRPQLLSEHYAVENGEQVQTIETANDLVRLQWREREGRIFFLLSVSLDQADDGTGHWARHAHLEPAQALQQGLEPYQSFALRQTSVQAEDAERIEETVARMIAELRSSRDGARLFRRPPPGDTALWPTTEIYALVRAWNEVRPDIARVLLDGLLAQANPDGSIPARLDENGLAADGTMDWPVLAHAFRLVWGASADRAWFDAAAPVIQRHLESIIATLDPARSGLPTWSAAKDALAPELHDVGLVSADLIALLVRDIGALEEVAQAIAVRSLDLTELLAYRTVLLTRLRDFLWSPETHSFAERYADGRPIIRQTISSVMPLLCRELSREECTALLNILVNRDHLLGATGVHGWVPWAEETDPPPVWPLHQLLLLEALDTQRATAEAAAIRAALLTQLPAPDSPATQALLLHLIAVPAGNRLASSLLAPTLIWITQRQRGILATAAAVFLLLNGAVILHSCRKTSLTPSIIETTVGLARRHYQEKNYAEAETVLARVLASGNPHASANLEMGNILYRQGRLDEAGQFYRKESPNPQVQAQAMHNLAVLLHEQGRGAEAAELWRQLVAEYGTRFPPVAARATAALKYLPAETAK
ncbi:MAG TPA: tetratricopeptide repeat protein [Kiritimatiellia bacterium]|nr:tetratricopeptide repeat protein [Kiritimatiellia bacterium]